MLKNYAKMALRGLRRHKGYTFINVAGLTVGMAACLLIAAWILDELSYDRFYERAGDLYRVIQSVDHPDEGRSGAGTDGPLAYALKATYPDIVDAGRVYYTYRDMVVRHEDRSFLERRVAGVDPSVLTMFGFSFVYGNPETALDDPFSLVLTEETARRYFGEGDPVGKEVVFDDAQELTVRGVIEDLPHTTHFRFDVLVPVELFGRIGIKETDQWYGGDDFHTYVLLQPGASPDPVSAKIAGEVRRHVPDTDARLHLQPLTAIHFDTANENEAVRGLDPAYLYLFGAIGVLILLVACVNFINLSTARSAERGKEIGVRKVMGAARRQLVHQFLGESTLLALLSGVLAWGLAELLLPFIRDFSGAAFTLDASQNAWLLVVLAGIVVLTGLGAGSYPAVRLSAFKPAPMLKGWAVPGKRREVLRKTLVVFQFSLTIVLFVSTLVVYRQVQFMKEQTLGYDGDQLVSVSLTMRPGRSIFSEQYGAFAQELSAHPGIASVSMAASSPADIQTAAGEATWEGKADDRIVLVQWCTIFFDFFETTGLEIVEGRSFSPDQPTDELDVETNQGAFVVNEAAVRRMGVESAVGLTFELFGKRGPIIGVVEDFHFGSLRNEIQPLAMFVAPFWNRVVLLRVPPSQMPAALAHLTATWERFAPDYPLEYHFVDAEYAQLYEDEERMGRLLNVFALLALIIACLGLFGLASYATTQRTKEIGIRKVLGATVSGLVAMLCSQFARWVLGATLVAWPLAYLLMRRWLNEFAYRIDMPWSVFLIAGLAALGLALLTVSYRALRAALANPVEALRYE